jgi:hypothetical protein
VEYAADVANTEIAPYHAVVVQRGRRLVHTALSTSALRRAMAAVSGQLKTGIEVSTTKKRIESRWPDPRRRICRKLASTARAAQTTIEYSDPEGVVNTVTSLLGQVARQSPLPG